MSSDDPVKTAPEPSVEVDELLVEDVPTAWFTFTLNAVLSEAMTTLCVPTSDVPFPAEVVVEFICDKETALVVPGVVWSRPTLPIRFVPAGRGLVMPVTAVIVPVTFCRSPGFVLVERATSRLSVLA